MEIFGHIETPMIQKDLIVNKRSIWYFQVQFKQSFSLFCLYLLKVSRCLTILRSFEFPLGIKGGNIFFNPQIIFKENFRSFNLFWNFEAYLDGFFK